MPAITVEYKPGMQFGVGVDTPSGDSRNACVVGDAAPIADATGDTVTFQMSEVTSIEDIQSALGVSASASGGVGLFSASAKMNYTESCHFHSSSVFLMVSVNVVQAFKSIRSPSIEAAAASLLTQGKSESFQNRFGDMFVRGLVTGGQFFGVIEVSSTSTTDQESLSVSLSGSYGMFNASGSVSQSFSKAIENRSVKVSCFIQGGQTSPLPTTPEALAATASNWPGSLVGKGVPYAALLDSYSILDLPDPPNYIDLQLQKDVLQNCSLLRNQNWFLMNEIDFLTTHQSQFVAPIDIPALMQYRNALAKDLNTISAAASLALNQPKSAAFPVMSAVPVVLPKRIDGQPVEPPKPVTIPNWVGLYVRWVTDGGTEEDGTIHQSAANLGLKIQLVTNPEPGHSEGEIASTDPAAGAVVDTGSVVILHIYADN